jgi:hypothetical protein
MSATIRHIVDDAQELIGEVSGPGVQMYSDDRMFADAIRAFNMLFKKYNWRNYCDWLQLTLDGVTGTVTTDELVNVQDFEDIIAVRRDGSFTNLTLAPRGISPFQPDMSSGSGPLYWNALNVLNPLYATKRIFVMPKTSTGKINVFAKFYPVQNDAWDWQDTFYMDRDMLVYGTAWATLSTDDLNAAAADMAKNMMEMRYKDILAQFASHEISFGSGGRSGIPNEWLVGTGV